MKSHQLINQDSGVTEYYTPQFILDAAREVMGGIDLDPASCEEANKRVRADIFFSKEDDGLTKIWSGNVWMNHPFSKENNAKWIQKLVSEYERGNIEQACCITFAATSEKWFRPLMNYQQCFLSPRTSYVIPGGEQTKGATKGSVVTYMGDHATRFTSNFNNFGAVKF